MTCVYVYAYTYIYMYEGEGVYYDRIKMFNKSENKIIIDVLQMQENVKSLFPRFSL